MFNLFSWIFGGEEKTRQNLELLAKFDPEQAEKFSAIFRSYMVRYINQCIQTRNIRVPLIRDFKIEDINSSFGGKLAQEWKLECLNVLDFYKTEFKRLYPDLSVEMLNSKVSDIMDKKTDTKVEWKKRGCVVPEQVEQFKIYRSELFNAIKTAQNEKNLTPLMQDLLLLFHDIEFEAKVNDGKKKRKIDETDKEIVKTDKEIEETEEFLRGKLSVLNSIPTKTPVKK